MTVDVVACSTVCLASDFGNFLGYLIECTIKVHVVMSCGNEYFDVVGRVADCCTAFDVHLGA